MLRVALIIFRVFAVPSMKRYDAEGWPRFHLEQPGGEKRMALEPWLLWRWRWEWRCWSRAYQPGTIVINPVAVASVLVYVIAASVALYFIWLLRLAGLNRKERARLAGVLYFAGLGGLFLVRV